MKLPTVLSRLFDFAPATPARSLYTEQAISRVSRWLAYMPELDEVLTRLGITRDRLRTLEGDDEVAQCLDTRREAVLATPWRLEPNQTRAARWLAEEIGPWIDPLVRGAWAAVPYGYSVIELVYLKRPSARIGIASLSEKPIEWFRPQADGSVRYLPDDGSGGLDGLAVDSRKYLLTVHHPTYRMPQGDALLSRAYWPARFRREGWKFWMNFLERFGTPILLGKTISPTSFIDAMQEAGIDTAFGVRTDEDITAVLTAQPGEFERVERALITRIQRLILGQTLTSDVGAAGSYAAAKVHNEVRQDKRNADLRLISATGQSLVDRLAALNGLQPPRFVMADDTGLEGARAERDAKLLPVLQASGLTLARNYFTDRYDLAEEDLVEAEPPESIPEDDAAGTGEDDAQGEAATAAQLLTLAPRRRPRFTPEQEAVEALGDKALALVGSPIPAADIRRAIDAATGPEDLAKRLAALLADSDPRAFREVMERALFAADIMGYGHMEAGR